MADVLVIDGCMRGWEVSRTYAITEKFLERYRKLHPEDTVEELHLTEERYTWSTGREVERNDRLVADAKFNAPEFAMARRFSKADKIILAAPFWNMMFPAAVTAYFENVCVNEITFRYDEGGDMKGLCAAKKLLCVMTSGGEFPGEDDARAVVAYLRALCAMLGIPETTHLWVEGLDIADGKAEERLQTGLEEAVALAETF